MTRQQAIALDLATAHAVAAGDPEPWTWATENVADFAAEAAVPWAGAEFDQAAAEAGRAADALDELANLFVGPPPAADAPAAVQAAYAEAVLRAFAEPPCKGVAQA